MRGWFNAKRWLQGRREPPWVGDVERLAALDAGWIPWSWEAPPAGVPVQVMRRVKGADWIGGVEDIDPRWVVTGLYWRLTGIAREQLGV